MKLTAITLAAAAALLGACASNPIPDPPELQAARASVRAAESDPAVLSSAPLELKKATDALSKANVAAANRAPLNEITSSAYVADREARAALAIASSKRAEDGIRRGELDRERARADIKDNQAQRAQTAATNAQMNAAVANNRAAVAEARADNATTAAISAQASADIAQQRNAQLQAQLSDLQARQTERGMLVTLGDVLFEFNRAEIKPTATAELRKLADFLSQHPERRVLIEGYTDNIGAAQYNATLSQRRAEAVAQALAAMGVSAQRISSVGYGKDYPVADNSTDTNRALNRRVEVYISDGSQPVRSRG